MKLYIAAAWAEKRPSGHLGDVANSLKSVMASVYLWSAENFGHISQKIETLRAELDEIKLSSADRVLIRAKMNEMDELLYREEMLWLHRSRITWLKEGDRNTKYFFRRAVWHSQHNYIHRLRRVDGTWCNVTYDMERMAASYFKEVYSKDPTLSPEGVLDCILPKVTTDMNASLCEPYTEKEISDALF